MHFATLREPQPEDWDVFLFNLREVDELLWVYEGLQRQVPAGAIALLEKAIGGSLLSSNEIDTQARNFLFELRIASYFLQAGVPITLNDRSDIVASFDDAVIHIECKRLESRKKVQQRAAESLRQLQSRLSGPSSKQYGLAAFDVGQILHPNQGLSWSVTAEHGRLGLKSQLAAFEDDFDLGRLFRPERRVLSVWLQMLVPILHLAEKQPATRFSSLHLVLAAHGRRRALFEKLRVVFEVEPVR